MLLNHNIPNHFSVNSFYYFFASVFAFGLRMAIYSYVSFLRAFSLKTAIKIVTGDTGYIY